MDQPSASPSAHPTTPSATAHGVDPAALADLAERAARQAGRLVAAARTGSGAEVGVAATKTSPVDVVTQTDLASEALLREVLLTERPHDGVLGEEDGLHAGTSGVTWVIDPIDGTVNFLYGIPAYAVCVAAVVGPPDPEHWTVVAACVHAVADGRTWTAALGGGARLDGAPLALGAPAPLSRSLCGTGFGYRAERRRAQAQVLTQVLPRVRDVRRIGSAALDLCAVASGQLDVYYERGLNPWDLAAASLVAQEAGVSVVGLRGRRAGTAMTVAGRGEALADLLALLEAADADAEDLSGVDAG